MKPSDLSAKPCHEFCPTRNIRKFTSFDAVVDSSLVLYDAFLIHILSSEAHHIILMSRFGQSRPGSRPAPLNRTVSPFTYAHSSIHFTVCANSCACPNLPRPSATSTHHPETLDAPPREYHLALEARARPGRHAVRHHRCEHAWRNRTHAHAVPREIAREREDHGRERALRRRVRGLARLALELLPMRAGQREDRVEMGRRRTAAALAAKMMAPRSWSGPSGATDTRCLSARRVRLNVPVRLTARVKSQRSSEWGLP